MKIALASALMVGASFAGAQSFFDDFNRPDSPTLGPNWTAIGTASATRVISNQAGNVSGVNNLSLVNSSNFTGAYTDTRVVVDIFHSGATTTGFVALAFGHNGAAAAGNGLYLKVQSQNSTAAFNFVGLYTGIGSGTTSFWTDPPVFFGLTSNFTSARMSAWASDATTINLAFDTDFNGIDDQVYTKHLNVGTMTFGNQVGLGVFGTNVFADNFSASVVPEPASMAVLGLGGLALLRRRRK